MKRWSAGWGRAAGCGLLGMVVACGCAGPDPVAQDTQARPIASQAPAHDDRVSPLLRFEKKSDAVFVGVAPAGARIDDTAARDGQGSLHLPAGTRRVVIKLPALLRGRRFPADWSMIGAYIRPGEPARLSAAYVVNRSDLATRRLDLPADQWSPVMFDLQPPSPLNQAKEPGILELRFDPPLPAAARVDDVVLVHNRRTLVHDPEGWTINQIGTRYIIDRPLVFRRHLSTRDATPEGWTAEEINPRRARFTSGTGETLTLYADGRSYRAGQFEALGAAVRNEPAYAAAHGTPGRVLVRDDQGRVDRNTPGDADNDGYNQARGAYQVIAAGPGVDIRLVPGTALPRPVFEVAGLPEGEPLVTVEGQLITTVQRIAPDRILFELPLRVERPIVVNVRVQ